MDFEESYRSFVAELLEIGDTQSARAPLRYLADFPSFVLQQRDVRAQSLPEGYVPMTILFLVTDDGTIQAELRLRHWLNPDLHIEGGHIGYVVRPSSRRMGFGREVLRQGLIRAEELGIDRVLITCDDDNAGSIGVIEANGGNAYETAQSPSSGKLIRQYWIQVP